MNEIYKRQMSNMHVADVPEPNKGVFLKSMTTTSLRNLYWSSTPTAITLTELLSLPCRIKALPSSKASLFYGVSLPVASTRWDQLTLSSLCSLF